MTKTEWRVILSSMSCAGRSLEVWPSISEALKTKNIKFSVKITDHKYHAIELATEALQEGFRKILVIGGDGAMHEVLNGVFSQNEVPTEEVTLAIIPLGSGNDWARLHKIPSDINAAVDLIAGGDSVVRLQDVARVKTLMDGRPYYRYMINIGGLGFDASVCYRFDVAKARGHAGDKQYLKSLLQGFLFYHCLNFKVRVDGVDFFRGPAMSVALGIGKYCGGGMMQTPEAVFDDGLIDLTVIKQMPKLRLISKIKKLYDGTLFQEKKLVSHTRGKVIEIKASPYSYMEVDGETIGVTPVTIEVLPSSIKVVSAYQSFSM